MNSSRTLSGLCSYVCSFIAFPVGGPNKGVHYTPSGFWGQCPLTGLWMLTSDVAIILIFRTVGIIWTRRFRNWRPLRRWAWLLFVFQLLWCSTFIFFAIWIQNHFPYLIRRQQINPSMFHTRKLTYCVEQHSLNWEISEFLQITWWKCFLPLHKNRYC